MSECLSQDFLLPPGDIARFNPGSAQNTTQPSTLPLTPIDHLKLSFSLMCMSHLRTVGEMKSTWREATVLL